MKNSDRGLFSERRVLIAILLMGFFCLSALHAGTVKKSSKTKTAAKGGGKTGKSSPTKVAGKKAVKTSKSSVAAVESKPTGQDLEKPPLPAVDNSLKAQAAKKISEYLGVPVFIQDYRLEGATLRLRGIAIGDRNQPDLPFAEIQDLSATCSLMSLLTGNLVLENIAIVSLSGRLTRTASGKLALGKFPVPASRTAPLEPGELPFQKIQGKNIEFRLLDEGLKKVFILRVPTLELAKPASGEAIEVHVEGALRASETGASATGNLPEFPFRGAVHVKGFSPFVGSGSAKVGPAPVRDLQAVIESLLPGSSGKIECQEGTAEAGVEFSSMTPTSPTGKAWTRLRGVSLLFPSTQLRMRGVSGDVDGTTSGPPTNLKIEGRAKFPAGQIIAPISTTNKSSYAFPFQDLSGQFRFADGTFAITDARAKVFGGTLTGKGTLDPRLTPVRFDLQVTGEALQAESFLAENTTQKQVISGPINGALQAAGDVTGLSSWNGKGSMNMKGGKYQAPPVVTPILSALNLNQFASGDLTGANGTFVLKNGILTTNDLFFQSTIGKLDYQGDVGLDTTLNGNMNLVFSKAAVDQSQILKDISLDGTSVSVPTKVRGTLLAPLFPGFSSGKLLELGLKRTGQKMLQDILLGKTKTPEAGNSSDSKKINPGKDLLRNLGSIFGKKRKQANPAPQNIPVTPVPSQPAPVESPKDPKKNLGKELQKLFKF